MSFFYNTRHVAYQWGLETVVMRGYDPYFAGGRHPGSETCVPIVPLPSRGAAKRSILTPSMETRSVEAMPCDKQLPWKKLGAISWIRSLMGLTIHGELYLVNDRSRGGLWQGLVRGEGLETTFWDARRVFLPDAPTAFKDFSYTFGATATGFDSNGALQSALVDNLTVITRDGRVFVAGYCGLGQHGIAPSTPKNDADLITEGYASYVSSAKFWQRRTQPAFPVATEVPLPGGVKAASAPSGTLASVIGEDGHLYGWWHDPLTNTTYPPRKLTGFVTRIRVVSPGSTATYIQPKWPDSLHGADPDEIRIYSYLDFSPPPEGGKKPVAFVGFDSSLKMSDNVIVAYPGLGYTSPPQAQLRGFSWSADAPQFECEIFGEDDGFITEQATTAPWLIGKDGRLYEYSQPFLQVSVPTMDGDRSFKYVDKLWPAAPRRVTHSSRRFKSAAGNCFVDESGAAYFAAMPFSQASGYSDWSNAEKRLPIETQGEYDELDIADWFLFDNLRFFYAGVVPYTPRNNNTIRKVGTQYRLYKIGDGYQSGICNVSANPADWTSVSILGEFHPNVRGRAFIGIKTDGSLWSAGFNMFGALGDTEDLTALRKQPQKVMDDAQWVAVYNGEELGAYGRFDYTSSVVRGMMPFMAVVAIRKDAICRSRDQPMEYYQDDYYSTLK